MKRLLEGSEHLVRLALAAAVLVLTFFVIRHFLVPPEFGKYGHFRPAALDEIAARPVSFAGRETCAACHDEVAHEKSQGKHAKVGCEACHGALAKHAEDPAANVPVKPDTAKLCGTCHEADSAKPKWFPQVVTQEHSGGVPCGTCHHPHQPKI